MGVASLIGPFAAIILGIILILGIIVSVVAVDEASKKASVGLEGNELIIYEYFKDKGFENVQIAAIMGNWFQESHLDPQAIQSPTKNILAPGGIGLAQWTDITRKENGILLYVKSKNRNGSYEGWDNINYQLDFAYAEIVPGANTDARAYAHLQWSYFEYWSKLTDIKEATSLFCEKWERAGIPAMDNRIQKAQEYLDKMSGVSGNLDYVKWAIDIANDNRHGYCQTHRTGNPDYDCSSLVYFALLNTNNIKDAGYPFATFGMGAVLKANGFEEKRFSGIADLQEGDILVNPQTHTEIYVGGGKTVGAHCDSSGGITCASGPGDQSGNEISVAGCSSSWQFYYRRK